jgi:NAD(P)H-hydrate epimerase
LPVVLDADGLRGLKNIRRGVRMPLIITPHMGELAMLLDRTPQEIMAKPVAFATVAARKYRATVVLKSYTTFTCVPNKDFYFLTVNGNPGMATAGSGDVLSGVITGLIASGQITPLAAAVAGPYVHALAGNIAAHQRSVDGIIASDILEAVPSALKAVKGW